MPMVADSPLTVRFPLLGRETQHVKEWSIEAAYMKSADDFSFTLFERDPALCRRLELQPVELLVGGASQLIGRIDRTKTGDDGTAVQCQGRDYLADLVEGNVDPGLRIKTGDKILDAVLDAAAPYGISAVEDDDVVGLRDIRAATKVKHTASPTKFTPLKLEDLKPKPGQGVYEFLNEILARQGGTLQPGADRTQLVVSAPHYNQEPIYGLVRTRDEVASSHNNVKTAYADRDYSRFPTFAIVQGLAGKAGATGRNASQTFDLWMIAAAFRSELGEILMASTVSERQQKGKVADQVAQGALYRLLVYRDENARTAEQIEAAARRCVAERLKDTLYYHATVKGHADPRTGAIWTVDTMVNVDDDVADVHEPLWIESRTLRFGSGGAETDLVCWRPESFTLGPTVWGGTPKAKPATTPKTKPGDRVGSAVGETQDANAGQ